MDFYFFKQHLIFSQHVMMEISSLEEENIVKAVRNFFRLNKLEKDTAIEGIRKPF